MIKKLIVIKFVTLFGSESVARSLTTYTEAKSNYYRGVIENEPSKPTCPPGIDIYDATIWAYAVNLYDYFFFSIFGTFAFLAMLGHLALKMFLFFL